jgi:hypothetical protein
MDAQPARRAGKAWPIVLILLILALVVGFISVVRTYFAEADGSLSSDLDASTVAVQHFAFCSVVFLFAWHQRRVLGFLLVLAARNWLIGAEIMLVVAIVFGALGSFGVPELFWDESAITTAAAGFSTAAFLALAWFTVYLIDYSRPERSRRRQMEWHQLKSIVEDSGLPAILGVTTTDVSQRGQVGWFLVIACLPGVFLLSLPALLPTIRPSSVVRTVEWTWLAGLILGTAAPQALILTRPIAALVWRARGVLGLGDSPEPTAILRHPGVLLWLLGLVYAAALIVDRFQPRWIVPASLLCLLLAMIAVAAVFWLSIRTWKMRLCAALVILVAMLLNGIQPYDPCYRGLEAYYPPDPLRLMVHLDSPFSENTASKPVNLVAFQERDDSARSHAQAVASRAQTLESWKTFVTRRARPGNAAERKPILVAIATCGGALRAGLWTTTVLDAIERELPVFPEHVRYITGASGGMVGGALFVTSRARASAGAGGRHEAASPGGLADRFSSDYLSPISRQFILRDLPFAIFPWRQSYDRGHALEDALVKDGGLTELGYTFSELAGYERAGEVPSIIFSPMLVEDGRRLLIGNLELADLTTIAGEHLLAESPEEIVELVEREEQKQLSARDRLEFRKINAVAAVEFFRLFPRARDSFQVVTAVRMNATFPVVTPTGILPTITPRQVVDAGYYDNYGVDLATGLLFANRSWLAENTSGVLLVQIRAFRNEKQLKVLDEPILAQGLINAASTVTNVMERAFRWLTSPVNGLAEARQAVMHYRNDGQIDVLGRYFHDRLRRDPEFFRTVIFTCDTELETSDEQQVETLNWRLTTTEMDQIKKNMSTREQNALRLAKLVQWWRKRMEPGASSPP